MLLSVNSISKLFDDYRGIKNISFNVKEGEIVTILGPSGCGKTTILNILGGFLKIDTGDILFLDKNINDELPEDRNISTIFQNYALFPHMNVIENVSYGLKYGNKISKKDRFDLANKYIDLVGLKRYEKEKISNLSGGQQQRVAIARSIITNPMLLLLDEPFSNLDAQLRVKMRKEIKELQEKFKISMLFVTHDQEEALSISDRIIVMNSGEIIQIGTPEEIYYNPKNDFVSSFIGSSNEIIDDTKMRKIRPEDIKMKYVDEIPKWRVHNKFFMGAITKYILIDIENKNTIEVTLIGKEGAKFNIGDRVDIEV